MLLCTREGRILALLNDIQGNKNKNNLSFIDNYDYRIGATRTLLHLTNRLIFRRDGLSVRKQIVILHIVNKTSFGYCALCRFFFFNNKDNSAIIRIFQNSKDLRKITS